MSYGKSSLDDNCVPPVSRTQRVSVGQERTYQITCACGIGSCQCGAMDDLQREGVRRERG